MKCSCGKPTQCRPVLSDRAYTQGLEPMLKRLAREEQEAIEAAKSTARFIPSKKVVLQAIKDGQPIQRHCSSWKRGVWEDSSPGDIDAVDAPGEWTTYRVKGTNQDDNETALPPEGPDA